MYKTCKECDIKFKTNSNRSTYCSVNCKNISSFKRKQEKLKQGVEGIDYIIDKWNGYATKRIYGKWIKSMHPGKTTKDYLREFPGAPLMCEKDKKSTAISGDKHHMKKVEYRKMASEAIKGERNPNHSSKVSKEVRKSRSPFSEKFRKYKSLDEVKQFRKIHCKKWL